MIEDWFETDEGELSPSHTTLVSIVRESARGWPECPPDATAVLVFRLMGKTAQPAAPVAGRAACGP
ncbi:hypothetical protein ACIA8I_37735 [Streptomyces rishiriensis]|uniref:hypothetical protein n=1 Tax=Streptomyces rishiriensis TaxID=68264 RepID=UPI00378CBA7F